MQLPLHPSGRSRPTLQTAGSSPFPDRTEDAGSVLPPWPHRPAGFRAYPPILLARRHHHLEVALIVAMLLVAGAQAVFADGLTASPSLSTDGVYQLSWSKEGPVILEEARRSDFADARTLYSGEDGSTTLSGRRDGTYFYRLQPAVANASERNEVLKVEVRHHPLARALGFFTLGAAVFASTVALIVRGGRAARKAG